MAIEKNTPQLVKKGKGKKRPGYKGGGADMGGVADSQGNVGPGIGGGGPPGSDNSGPDDRSSKAQTAAHNAAVAAAREFNRAENAKNKTQFGFNKPKSKFGGVGGILSSLLGLVNPAFGLLSKGLGYLGSKVGDLRGYNEDGTPRTQAEYEAMVADRKVQGRINNMTDRMLAGKTFSQTNLDNLMGMTDRFGNPFGTNLGNIDNVRGPNSIRGILNSGVPIGVAPMGVNVPTGIQSIDVGYNDPAFENNLMAGLTKMQQKMLSGPQKNLKNIMGISDQEILNNISPFNDPNDPATLEEVQSFYTT